MTDRRLLIYSHDSFGLGHLRRCRSIALSLVARDPGLKVRILSGLPIISSFDLHPQIDVALVPGIIKMQNGEYRASSGGALEQAIEQRSAIIRATADDFRPDMLLVDKEPLGIRGEVRDTLHLLRQRGVPVVLGLRDVLDDPALLVPEWQRKQSLAAVEEFYDEIWIYGLPQIYDPLRGLAIPDSVRQRIVYTAYLDRDPSPVTPLGPPPRTPPYLVVTPGGGGDGEALVDWVLSACEAGLSLPWRVVVVCGPFMDVQARAGFAARAATLPGVEVLTFEPDMESLVAGADALVAMGGYNTFCEILSFDKPALLVPRTQPRREQLIRAERAQALGLVTMLADDGVRDPAAMAEALAGLAGAGRPSQVVIPGLLDGHRRIAERFDAWMDRVAPGMSLHVAVGD